MIATGLPRVDAKGVCTDCRALAEDCVCEPVAARREPSPSHLAQRPAGPATPPGRHRPGPRLAVVGTEHCGECDTPHQVYGYR